MFLRRLQSLRSSREGSGEKLRKNRHSASTTANSQHIDSVQDGGYRRLIGRKPLCAFQARQSLHKNERQKIAWSSSTNCLPYATLQEIAEQHMPQAQSRNIPKST